MIWEGESCPCRRCWPLSAALFTKLTFLLPWISSNEMINANTMSACIIFSGDSAQVQQTTDRWNEDKKDRNRIEEKWKIKLKFHATQNDVTWWNQTELCGFNGTGRELISSVLTLHSILFLVHVFQSLWMDSRSQRNQQTKKNKLGNCSFSCEKYFKDCGFFGILLLNANETLDPFGFYTYTSTKNHNLAHKQKHSYAIAIGIPFYVFMLFFPFYLTKIIWGLMTSCLHVNRSKKNLSDTNKANSAANCLTYSGELIKGQWSHTGTWLNGIAQCERYSLGQEWTKNQTTVRWWLCFSVQWSSMISLETPHYRRVCKLNGRINTECACGQTNLKSREMSFWLNFQPLEHDQLRRPHSAFTSRRRPTCLRVFDVAVCTYSGYYRTEKNSYRRWIPYTEFIFSILYVLTSHSYFGVYVQCASLVRSNSRFYDILHHSSMQGVCTCLDEFTRNRLNYIVKVEWNADTAESNTRTVNRKQRDTLVYVCVYYGHATLINYSCLSLLLPYLLFLFDSMWLSLRWWNAVWHSACIYMESISINLHGVQGLHLLIIT